MPIMSAAIGRCATVGATRRRRPRAAAQPTVGAVPRHPQPRLWSSGMLRLAAAPAAVAALLLSAPADTQGAHSAYCAPIRDSRAEVVSLSSTLGCGAIRRVALRTTESRYGYYRSSSWYCRWGQGGTSPVHYDGHVYFAGFCASVPSFRGTGFLGRRLG